jgi:hypothetical protein
MLILTDALENKINSRDYRASNGDIVLREDKQFRLFIGTKFINGFYNIYVFY